MDDDMIARPRILVVDNDTAINNLIAFYLHQARFQVDTATIIAGALAILRTHPPALMILDVSLDEGENAGFEFCHAIRTGEAHCPPEVATMPILLVTARNSRQDRRIGLAAGASDYLTKPFQSHELVERVARLLRING